MIALLIASMFGLAMIILSVRANARFKDEERLPMQWSLSGSVNWTAPRKLALGFIPGLAIVMLAVIVSMIWTLQPRPGQEDMELPILMVIGSAFVGSYLLHLWLIDKTISRTSE
jgi:hypothetical protein